MLIQVPIFADFPMLPMGSADEHAKYMAKFNYRFYCASCIRNIEAVERLQACPYCGSSNLVVLMEKEVKEHVPLRKRLGGILKPVETQKKPRFSFEFGRKNVEEFPTDVIREMRGKIPANKKEEHPSKMH